MMIKRDAAKSSSQPAQSEYELQTQVAHFLKRALPADATFSHFPLGGGGRLRGAKIKAMGAMVGWPDLQVLWQGRLYLIELKTTRGVVSEAQIITHARIHAAGAPVAVCRTVGQVEAALVGWSVPLRARLSV